MKTMKKISYADISVAQPYLGDIPADFIQLVIYDDQQELIDDWRKFVGGLPDEEDSLIIAAVNFYVKNPNDRFGTRAILRLPSKVNYDVIVHEVMHLFMGLGPVIVFGELSQDTAKQYVHEILYETGQSELVASAFEKLLHVITHTYIKCHGYVKEI